MFPANLGSPHRDLSNREVRLSVADVIFGFPIFYIGLLMIFVLPDVLIDSTLAKIRRLAEGVTFVDGMRTTGNSVRYAKHNREIASDSKAARAINQEINQALAANNDFQVITVPRRLSPFLINRYTTGMRYGDHSDNAVLSAGGGQRSDMSMTLFLNEPDEYDGGALALNVDLKPESYRLPAGHCVIYPTYFLHRVEEVTRGTRLVSVGWIQSLIRDPFKRQILIDLAMSLSFFLNSTSEKQRHPEYIRLEKVHNNLKHQWVEL